MRDSGWNECEAHARYVDDQTGRETVVTCDKERHADPYDTDEPHHDPRLGIIWYFDDDEVRFDY